MRTTTSHRISAGLAPLLAAGLALSACGGSDGEAASLPTVTLEAGATSYATLPPATVASEVVDGATTTVDPTAVQDYEVQAGDYGLKVANDFGVSIEDLEAVNGWSDAGREFPFPGTIIKIPAGATPPSATPAETPTATPAAGGTETE
ncbi:MAG: LysM peptidoglycan-binding domain-containing protein, partial [Ilumatobacter sp.]